MNEYQDHNNEDLRTKAEIEEEIARETILQKIHDNLPEVSADYDYNLDGNLKIRVYHDDLKATLYFFVKSHKIKFIYVDHRGEFEISCYSFRHDVANKIQSSGREKDKCLSLFVKLAALFID